MSGLAVEGVSFGYQAERIFSNLSFQVGNGQCVALLGGNGAGKTTLLKILAGLLKADAGTITWQGRPVTGSHFGAAYLPQRETIDWAFPITVRGVVEMGRYPRLGMWKKFSRSDKEVADQALAAVGLSELARVRISELSGGQQQRVFAARALAQEAEWLLLDEPFNGLDQTMSEELSIILRNLAADGKLVLASHHDLSSVPGLFDSVIMLHRGLVAAGPVGEVFTESNIRKALGLPEGSETNAVTS